ncbi:MAG TPA: hypothetical protein HPP51_00780 [Planctomycetes bacterium]|nr:hypothetical protein [Planctomycetota bacterium]
MAKENLQEKDVHFAFAYTKKDSIDTEKRRIRFIFTSDKLDRHNDIMQIDAIVNAIRAFGNNPAFLACHQHRLAGGNSPVIGSWDTESFKAKKHQCEMDAVFATTPLGEEYWNLYSNKHQRAVSIGFIPIEFKDEKDESAGWIRTYTKIELLEISAVAVGANREALTKANERLNEIFGPAKEPQGKTADRQDLNEKLIGQIKDLLDDKIDEIKSIIITDSDGFADNLLREKESDSPGLAGDQVSRAMDLLQIINSKLSTEA